MGQPAQSDVHVDRVLTTISVAYIQQDRNFIASRIFPVVPVEKQSDKYFTYTKADWFRDEAQRRPDATESAGSGYGVSTATYSADVYALHKDIGDQTRANSDSPLDPDRDATLFLTQRMLLRQEKQWVSDYFTTSVWGTDLTPSALWSNYTTSDPIADIETGIQTILSNTGFKPNKMALGYTVYRQLKHHPDIVDRFKYTQAGVMTEQILASLFGLDEIVTAMAINNTAVEGETAAYAFTHGKHALLAYAPSNPGILTPSAGYTFVWRGVSDGMGANVGVSRFRMPQLRADRIESQMAWDNKVVATDLGYFFNGAVA